MPSNSLIRWNGERTEALDEIENAHVMVGGSERGRPYATQQINYAYAALLSSHFQGFCRDLHSGCVEQIVAIVPMQIQDAVRNQFIWNRSLGRGNPHPSRLVRISIGWASTSSQQSWPWTRGTDVGASCFKH